jgi:hypothetical protein
MIIEYNEKFNFNHIVAEEGMVITDWNQEDIKEYSSAKEMYCPVSLDLSHYYEISDEMDAEYREAQEKAFREEEMRRERE